MSAAEVIEATRLGRTFRDARRGIAHLDYTLAELAVSHPTMRLVIAQTPYNTGVKQSAGTHDYSSVYDFTVSGVTYSTAQDALRELGWAAWWRHEGTWADPSDWHIHAVSLGYEGQVGVYVPGQVADYYAHRSGLAGHVADNTWHPADIDSTIFDYDRWTEEQEMARYEAQLDDIQAAIGVLGAKVETIAAAEVKRDRASWKRDLKIIKEMVENGATLDELAAYVDKHGQPD